MIATDHAPHTLEEKRRPYPQSPSGLPAVENSLALMLTQVNSGRCTLEQVVHWMCEAPARVWDVLNKGAIVRGFDADLVLVDLHKQAEVRDERAGDQVPLESVARHDADRLARAHVGAGPGSVLRRAIRRRRASGREVQFDHAPGRLSGAARQSGLLEGRCSCVWRSVFRLC